MGNNIEMIARLVYDYSKSGQLADGYFVYSVLLALVDKWDLEAEVKNLNFDLANNDLLCAYDVESSQVLIDMKRLKDHIVNRINNEKVYGLIDNDYGSMVIKYNLSIINAIAHELAHAYQYKICNAKKRTLEAKILRESLTRTILGNKIFYEDQGKHQKENDFIMMLAEMENNSLYYIALPSERMANIWGLETEKNIVNILYPKNDLNTYCDLRLLKGRLLGYDIYNSPTAYIFDVHNKARKLCGLKHKEFTMPDMEKEFNAKAKKANYSLQDRLYYGLPVTDQEYNKLYDESVDLIKKLTISSE